MKFQTGFVDLMKNEERKKHVNLDYDRSSSRRRVKRKGEISLASFVNLERGKLQLPPVSLRWSVEFKDYHKHFLYSLRDEVRSQKSRLDNACRRNKRKWNIKIFLLLSTAFANTGF